MALSPSNSAEEPLRNQLPYKPVNDEGLELCVSTLSDEVLPTPPPPHTHNHTHIRINFEDYDFNIIHECLDGGSCIHYSLKI